MNNSDYKVHWMTQTVFWIAMTILFICGLGIIIPCLGISVSNYTQIVEVKKDTNDRLKEIEDKFNDSNIFDSAYKKEVDLFIRMKLQELLKVATRPFICSIKDYHMTEDNRIIASVIMPKRELRPGSDNDNNILKETEEKVFVVDIINQTIKEAN